METKRDSFGPVETEVEAEAEFEAQRMQSTPFNRIAEIERSNKEYRERRARLRELTTEKPVQELTPQEELTMRLHRAEKILSELHPGSPNALSVVCSCLLDVVDAVTYILEKDGA